MATSDEIFFLVLAVCGVVLYAAGYLGARGSFGYKKVIFNGAITGAICGLLTIAFYIFAHAIDFNGTCQELLQAPYKCTAAQYLYNAAIKVGLTMGAFMLLLLPVSIFVYFLGSATRRALSKQSLSRP